MLFEMLNDFFDELFFIEYFKDTSNRNLKIIESCEDLVANIFFIVEVWSYLRLKSMLSSSSKVSEGKKRFLILRDRVKSEVQFHLYESIV